MSIYIEIDSKIMKACENYKNRNLSSANFAWIAYEISNLLCSKEDENLSDMLYNINSTFDTEWYMNFMDIEETEKGHEMIRKAILPYVGNVEKLIIRGSENGDPITDEERELWWKKQKEREREEFYKRNGYYENE